MLSLGLASTAAALALTPLAPGLDPAAPCMHAHSHSAVADRQRCDRSRAGVSCMLEETTGSEIRQISVTYPLTMVAGRRCTRPARGDECRQLSISRNAVTAALLLWQTFSLLPGWPLRLKWAPQLLERESEEPGVEYHKELAAQNWQHTV